jgi:hypothetical protein
MIFTTLSKNNNKISSSFISFVDKTFRSVIKKKRDIKSRTYPLEKKMYLSTNSKRPFSTAYMCA